MRTDGVFKTKIVRLKDWPVGKPLQLIPFGDIHHDSPAHAAEDFARFKEYAQAQEGALFLGMGDYLDSFSTSERAIIYDGRLHESTRKREEVEARKRVSKLADELAFMKGRMVGLLGGNHFPVFMDGTTGDQLLANKLDASYLGSCCAIRIVFTRPGGGAVGCDIFAHHGRGGGATAGGRFNAVEKLANVCDADIFLMGDNHARGCFPMGDRLYITSGDHGGNITVKSKTRWIGRTGSFLRGYVENEASYVVDAALPPSNLGWIEFVLTPVRPRAGGVDKLELSIGSRQ